jgi:hypothetical protein
LPLRAVENYNSVVEQCEKLKKSLGLTREQEQQNENEPVKAMQQLQETFKDYVIENRNAFTFKSPCCKKTYLLYRRVDDMNVVEHPFFKGFKGSELYNEKLFELYESKKITMDEIAEILGVNKDYIERIYQEVFLIEKQKKNA